MMKQQAPVAKNEDVTLTCEALTEQGEGIARYKGFTVMVPDFLPGEEAKVHIVQVKTHYAYGKVQQRLTDSADRVVPTCPLYGKCGGCQISHMSYEAQLRFKRDKVSHCLTRIGHFTKDEVDQVLASCTLGMESVLHYRNKAQFPVQMAADGSRLEAGFFAPRSHRLLAMYDCQIQSEKANELLKAVVQTARSLGTSAYDERTGEGLLRHVLIRTAHGTSMTQVCLVINGKSLPHQKEWIERMRASGASSLSLNVNTRRTNVILGSETVTLYGEPYMTDEVGGLKFHISPASFYQVNPVQMEVLYQTAIRMADLSTDCTVFDLYCGIGTITLFTAAHAKRVVGVEVVPDAVRNARENAALNGLSNVEFYEGQAEKVVPSLLQQGIRADVMMVDPPRAGCDAALLQTILDYPPQRLVYISCDPATLARDLDILCHGKGNFQLVKAQTVDMFPFSHHVETVCLLSREK